MSSKLTTTPKIERVENLIGGAMLFTLPQPEHLIVAEFGQLPCAGMFPAVVRTYLWQPGDTQWHGMHAHKTARNLFVCVNHCKIKFSLHNGEESVRVELKKQGDALFLPPMIWYKMQAIDERAMLWGHSNEPYNRTNYIEDFQAYLEELRQQKSS